MEEVVRRVCIALLLVALTGFVVGPPASADSVAPNSGLPGSTCVPQAASFPYTAPGSGVSINALGLDAPGYHEVGRPMGDFLGLRSKGVMLVIHGGGWFAVGKEAVASARPIADRWRARGWTTVNLDYRGCSSSIVDVLWFMKRVRAALPTAVICATGASAGAHLALILASIRHDVACTIALAGPSDFDALLTQTAYDYRTGDFTSFGPERLYYAGFAAFGYSPSPLSMRSPIRYAATLQTRLLLASGEHDLLVPQEQNANYAAAITAAQPSAYVDVVVLPAGDRPFVHGRVSQAGLDDLSARELTLVTPLVG